MRKVLWSIGVFALLAAAITGCNREPKKELAKGRATTQKPAAPSGGLNPMLAQKYIEVSLTADLSGLSENRKKMIPIMIEISDIMDELFWLEAYGEKEPFLNGIADPETRRFAEINYGPWDRLDGNKPFIDGVGDKNLGANFYPPDITKEEINDSDNLALKGLYTLVRRSEDGSLRAVPYHEAFAEQVNRAAAKLEEAAALAEDASFKEYLELRAQALRTDEYFESDMAWMDMKTNALDFVVGPIEVYEDELFNYKAGHEAYVLVKDGEWSERLAKYADVLPELQRGLPVPDAYKTETPGSDSDLNAYDVIYYAGHSNAGSKTIAINLPNDEKVQLQKGTRRLQLKNAMKAKFDKILVPIANVLIAEDQRHHITFDAFFSNTMFHEVAHGLGIKNTINERGTVREALKEQSSALEEGKADVLGLYMITSLHGKGDITGDLHDYYVTFIASIFRSIRFGSSSAHGRANLLRFNFFKEMGAFSRDEETGTYRVDFDKMGEAMTALSQKILTLQGDGDYDGVLALMEEKGKEGAQLRADLDRLAEANIPTDIVFKQGTAVLGL